MRRKPAESYAQWGNRRYCSRSCASIGNRRTGSKPCQKCGTVFHRKNGRSGESLSKWTKRKYCSLECAGSSRLANRKPDLLIDAKPLAAVIGALVDAPSLEDVATQARVHPASVKGVLVNNRVAFATADRLLTRLGLTHLWWTDPVLAEAYEKAA